MKSISIIALTSIWFLFIGCSESSTQVANNGGNLPNITGYQVVSTNQSLFYDTSNVISAPSLGNSFYGQDAQYTRNEIQYQNNGDGTITDMITGLMWEKSPDKNGDGVINVSDKKTYAQAISGANSCRTGGYTDWRLPTIKELYSLIIFSGVDPSGYTGTSTSGLIPFINTDYFDFAYGDTQAGERIIDAQYASSNMYVDGQLLFGVNFADGRIKGYGLQMPFGPGDKTFDVIYVRGNSTYGINNFVDNGDSTITDNSTGLMWMKNDSKTGMTWQNALDYSENLQYAGHSDWRLPDAKELQSILDYTRSPGTINSAAIDPLFYATAITNEAGQSDYGCYWTSTTHSNWSSVAGGFAAYVSFGRAMGYMDAIWQDVHGAGAQRSDPKAGNPNQYPTGNGPQGDAIRIYNYVRCVRNIN
jgi:hypothetical protein